MPKLICKPLDEARNEIRLLQPVYDKEGEQGSPLGAEADSDTPRFSLKIVSLDDFTEDTKADMKAKHTDMTLNRDHKLWEDSCRRRASASIQSDQSDTAELVEKYYARWVWGDYFAFSYVWGESRENRQVEVNGVMHSVTDNLFRILQRLWLGQTPGLSVRRIESTLVWADAICINQEDLEERSCQVKRMGTTYRHAFATYAFLEDGTDCSNMGHGLTVLESLASEYRSPEACRAAALASTSGPHILSSLKAMGSFAILSVGDVLRSTYWDRLWIIQENQISILLVFVCHDQALICDDFTDGLGLLQCDVTDFSLILKSASQGADVFGDVTFWGGRLCNIYLLQSMRLARLDRSIKSGGYLGHHQLMQRSLCTQQKDDRDKVYGLLSLFDDGLRKALSPNYRLSVNQVYTDFARVSICHFKSLDFICFPRLAILDVSVLPSWVPDWRRESQGKSNLTDLIDLSYSSNASPYRTTADSKIEVEFRSAGVLSAKGFRFDICDGFGICWYDQVHEGIIQTSADHNMVYGSFEATRDALWKTMTGDPDRSRETRCGYELLLEIPGDEKEGYYDLLPTVRDHWSFPLYNKLRKGNGCLRLRDRYLKEYFDVSGCHVATSEKSICYAMDEAASHGATCKLFVTVQGYFGLAPQQARKGDLICLLLGCSIPVILRPVGDGDGSGDTGHWTFVGGCYVQGIMDGEAMKLAEDDPSILRTFNIF